MVLRQRLASGGRLGWVKSSRGRAWRGELVSLWQLTCWSMISVCLAVRRAMSTTRSMSRRRLMPRVASRAVRQRSMSF
jgi:hypothetical protein